MAIITTSISGPKKGIPHRLRAGVVIRTPERAETDGEYYERNLGFFNNSANVPTTCPKCEAVLIQRMKRLSPGNITSVTLNCSNKKCKRVYVSAYPAKKVNAYGN